MLRRTTLATAALLCALGLAGCAMSTGTDSSSVQPTSQAQTSQKQPDTPPVEQPKNLQAVAGACDLFTSEQLEQHNLGGTPRPDESVWGDASCEWESDNGIIAVTQQNQIGVETMYKNAKKFGDFNPTELHGYPGMIKTNQNNICRIQFAVSETAAFAVNFTRFGDKDPAMQDSCAFTKTMASEVLKNIPDA
ncbi:DUF3558 domain-containing protein [Salinifilum ghardaiensis]